MFCLSLSCHTLAVYAKQMLGFDTIKQLKLNPILGMVQSPSQVQVVLVVIHPPTPSRQLSLSFRLRHRGPETRAIQHTWMPLVVLRRTAVLEMYAVKSDMSMLEP